MLITERKLRKLIDVFLLKEEDLKDKNKVRLTNQFGSINVQLKQINNQPFYYTENFKDIIALAGLRESKEGTRDDFIFPLETDMTGVEIHADGSAYIGPRTGKKIKGAPHYFEANGFKKIVSLVAIKCNHYVAFQNTSSAFRSHQAQEALSMINYATGPIKDIPLIYYDKKRIILNSNSVTNYPTGQTHPYDKPQKSIQYRQYRHHPEARFFNVFKDDNTGKEYALNHHWPRPDIAKKDGTAFIELYMPKESSIGLADYLTKDLALNGCIFKKNATSYTVPDEEPETKILPSRKIKKRKKRRNLKAVKKTPKVAKKMAPPITDPIDFKEEPPPTIDSKDGGFKRGKYYKYKGFKSGDFKVFFFNSVLDKIRQENLKTFQKIEKENVYSKNDLDNLNIEYSNINLPNIK